MRSYSIIVPPLVAISWIEICMILRFLVSQTTENLEKSRQLEPQPPPTSLILQPEVSVKN